MCSCRCLADTLQSVLAVLPAGRLKEKVCIEIVGLELAVAEVQHKIGSRPSLEQRIDWLFRYVFLADHLAVDSSMRAVLLQAASVLISPEFAKKLDTPKSGGALPCVPDAASLSRARLTCDAGHMLMRRDENRQLHEEGCVRYLMVDSSPQYHRDFEMILERTVRLRDLACILKASWEQEQLWGSRLTEESVTDAQLAADVGLANLIKPRMKLHSLPPSQLGFGAAGVSRKAHAILHSIRLEVASRTELKKYTDSVLCVLSDLGVEAFLSRLERCRTLSSRRLC